MNRNVNRGWFCACVLAAAWPGLAQDQAGQPQEPSPSPSSQSPSSQTTAAAPAPPRETASDVNSGRGLSIEPLYWLTSSGNAGIRGGSKFSSTVSSSGNLNYSDLPKEMIGAVVTVPAGRSNAVRVTYFAARSFVNGGAVAQTPLNIFGTGITAGDPIATSYKFTNFKLSYDFLTYFFKRGNTDFRVKTLWEIQYFSTNNSLVDFVPQPDGTFVPTSINKDKTIIYPTFGLGLEHTISRHVRWEAKASGFALPHKAALGDAEASIAFRFGRIEFIGGGKMYHFKTSAQDDNFVRGTIYGPYAGIRLYWKKQ